MRVTPMTQDEAMNILTSHYRAPFPHCDQYVLHSPGTCEVCDHFPLYQALRIMWEIDFTNTMHDGNLPCPAKVRRDESVINQWHGNRPKPDGWLRG